VTRGQAIIIGILTGGVVLVCIGLIAVMVFDPTALLPAPAAPTLPPPAATPTPTLPSFLPTASLETPVLEPTATFTRVPTATPRPPASPTPTVVFTLPTLPPRPTATQVVEEPIFIPPTSTPTPGPPTPIPPRSYSVSFRAQNETIVEGDCTNLEWETQGVSMIRLDGREVSASGDREVCPTADREYELTVQLPDNRIESSRVRITVQASNNNSNSNDNNNNSDNNNNNDNN